MHSSATFIQHLEYAGFFSSLSDYNAAGIEESLQYRYAVGKEPERSEGAWVILLVSR
jgi:hypothetical protein